MDIEQINIIVTILSSILTGGILMIFIESNQVFHQANLQYNKLMQPFLHSFSNYVKFIESVKVLYAFKTGKDTGNMGIIKSLIDKVGQLGSKSIMAGHDYGLDYFSAKNLSSICNDINNIWYYVDRSHEDFHRYCGFKADMINNWGGYAKEYLKGISPIYNDAEINEDTIWKVSGDFYVNIYQPIEGYPEFYEEWKKKETIFKWLSFGCILATIVSMLAVLLGRWFIPMSILNVFVIISAFLLLIQLFLLIKLEQFSRIFNVAL